MSMEDHGANNVNRERLLIRPPELSGNPTSRVIWYQAGGVDELNYEFGLAKYLCAYLQVIFYMP
jgi:hypothetical protein